MSTPASLIAGRYRLDVALATGGMGVVWRGWDERLERAVAIKQLRLQPGLSASDSAAARERALREARITARLHHPNAVPIYDVVEHEGEPCLIMQFLPSVSLQATLQRRGSLPLIDVARIGSEIASALTAAHRVGIVHRDVKPGNVLIVADGAAKLTDFGISHAMGDANLTSTGMVTGTPAYLAPEVARGEPATFASDVFSLGATLYTASEGTPPFEPADNPMALLHRVAAGHVRPPTRSGALTPLLTRMLAADPRARPSMTEAWVDLTSLHASSAISGSADLATTQLPPVLPTQHPDSDAAVTRRSTTSLEGGRSSIAGPPPAAVRPSARVRTPEPAPSTPIGGRAGEGNRRGGHAAGILTAVVALAAVVAALVYFVPKLGQGSHQPGSSGVSSKTHPATKSGATRASASSPAPTANSTTAQPTSSSLTTPSPPTPSPTTPSPTTSAPAEGTTTPSRTPSATAGTTTANKATPTATKATKTKPTSAEKTTQSTGAVTAGGSRLAGAVTDYYALIPDNLDAGYARLTPAYQTNHAGGYSGYQRFWGRMRSVSTTNVDGQAPDAATATITYHYKSGRTVVERTRYRLVRTGGRLLIADSAVLTSGSR